MSLRHGYTNATRIDGERVVKRYVGMDAAERMRIEVDAIQRTAGRAPTPEIVHVDAADCVVTFRLLQGRHGLRDRPAAALWAERADITAGWRS
jgi:hypothetical protein